jgi:hypothetical protein
MDYPRLNLDDLLPLWEREFAHLMRESVLDREGRRYVDLPETPGGKEIVRERRAFAQQRPFRGLIWQPAIDVTGNPGHRARALSP